MCIIFAENIPSNIIQIKFGHFLLYCANGEYQPEPDAWMFNANIHHENFKNKDLTELKN